jgi:uncharacterized protein
LRGPRPAPGARRSGMASVVTNAFRLRLRKNARLEQTLSGQQQLLQWPNALHQELNPVSSVLGHDVPAMNRRDLLRWSTAGACGVGLGANFWRQAYAGPAVPGDSPYGPMSATADANGLRLPAGFTSRIIARTGLTVPGTSHRWHLAPDGGACFPMTDGGWAYTSNSEVPLVPGVSSGGAGMIRFSAAGTIVEARGILSGTMLNCAGGPTPWGSWLSCEEFFGGRVWECYLDGRAPQVRGALGTFSHEAVAVDPVARRLYLTEDESDGRFYQFRPSSWPNLSSGKLYAAQVAQDSLGQKLTWREVPNFISARTWPMSTYTSAFNGGEGCWYDSGLVYFTTKGDNKVRTYDTTTGRLEVIHDPVAHPDSPLRGVDNVVVNRAKEVFVAEDGGDMQLGLLTPGPDRVVAPFLQVVGHDGSEITGPAFNPAGDRLYFSSQRGANISGVPKELRPGFTFEVRGPFHL